MTTKPGESLYIIVPFIFTALFYQHYCAASTKFGKHTALLLVTARDLVFAALDVSLAKMRKTIREENMGKTCKLRQSMVKIW